MLGKKRSSFFKQLGGIFFIMKFCIRLIVFLFFFTTLQADTQNASDFTALNNAIKSNGNDTNQISQTINITSDISLPGDNNALPLNFNFTSSQLEANLIDLTIQSDTSGLLRTIDGGSLTRGFFCFGAKGSTITLKDLRFSNCNATGGAGGAGGINGGGGGGGGLGGAIFVYENSTVTLDNVEFSNCAANGGDGGSVNSSGEGGGGGGGAFGAGGSSAVDTGPLGSSASGGIGGGGRCFGRWI